MSGTNRRHASSFHHRWPRPRWGTHRYLVDTSRRFKVPGFAPTRDLVEQIGTIWDTFTPPPHALRAFEHESFRQIARQWALGVYVVAQPGFLARIWTSVRHIGMARYGGPSPSRRRISGVPESSGCLRCPETLHMRAQRWQRHRSFSAGPNLTGFGPNWSPFRPTLARNWPKLDQA